MKKIILFLLSLFTLYNIDAQTLGLPLNTAVKYQISNPGSTGSSPNFVINGYVTDDLSRWDATNVVVGDSLYVLDGSDLFVFKVDSIIFQAGAALSLRVKAINNDLAQIPPGQAAIIHPTAKFKYPTYISTLRDDLRSAIMNRFSYLLDATIKAGDKIAYTSGLTVPANSVATVDGYRFAKNNNGNGDFYKWNGTDWVIDHVTSFTSGGSLGFLELVDDGITYSIAVTDIAPVQDIQSANNDFLVIDNPGGVVTIKIAQQGATTGQVLAWNGSTWEPDSITSGETGRLGRNFTDGAGIGLLDSNTVAVFKLPTTYWGSLVACMVVDTVTDYQRTQDGFRFSGLYMKDTIGNIESIVGFSAEGLSPIIGVFDNTNNKRSTFQYGPTFQNHQADIINLFVGDRVNFTKTNPTNNTATEYMRSSISGNPIAGFGMKHLMRMNITGSGLQDAASTNVTWTNPTGAGRDSKYSIFTVTNAVLVEGLNINDGYVNVPIGISVTGPIKDSSGDVGTAGQVLSSTVTGTNWVAAGGGGSSDALGTGFTAGGGTGSIPNATEATITGTDFKFIYGDFLDPDNSYPGVGVLYDNGTGNRMWSGGMYNGSVPFFESYLELAGDGTSDFLGISGQASMSASKSGGYSGTIGITPTTLNVTHSLLSSILGTTSTGKTRFVDNSTVKEGLESGADYGATYSLRSYVDKENALKYVHDSIVANRGLGNGFNHVGGGSGVVPSSTFAELTGQNVGLYFDNLFETDFGTPGVGFKAGNIVSGLTNDGVFRILDQTSLTEFVRFENNNVLLGNGTSYGFLSTPTLLKSVSDTIEWNNYKFTDKRTIKRGIQYPTDYNIEVNGFPTSIPDLQAVRKIVQDSIAAHPGGSYTDEQAQDAVGAMVDANSLAYTDATPLLSVKRQMSVSADGSGIKLLNDATTPGNNKLYGTDASGVKGWYDQSSAGVTTGPTLTGDGSGGSPLDVAVGGVTTTQIQDGTILENDIDDDAVTGTKIFVPGQAKGDILVYNTGGWSIVTPTAAGDVLTSTGTTSVPEFQPPTGGSGDNWGSDVVNHGSTLTGNGTVGTPLNVATGGITTTEILNGTIGNADLAANSVQASNIDVGSVGTNQLLDGGVATIDIANSAVTGAKIAANAIDSTKISNFGISLFDIGQNGASTGQFMKWNGNIWIASADNNSGGDINNGGNTTGADLNVGTNDANGFNIETNNIPRLNVTGGAITGGQLTSTQVTANTNTVADNFISRLNSSGTVSTGFGMRHLYQLESTTTDNRDAGAFDVVATTATDASRTYDFVFNNVNNATALAETFRILGNGSTSNNVSTTATNAAFDAWTISGNSTGVPAANFGPSIYVRGESSTTNNRDMARLNFYWPTATDASRRSAMKLQLSQNGGALADYFTWTTNGGTSGLFTVGNASAVSITNASMTTAATFTFGNSNFTSILGGSAGTAQVISSGDGSTVSISNTHNGATSTGQIIFGSGLGLTQTSGTRSYMNVNYSFSPTSGTAENNAFVFTGTVNQTGGANGIVRRIADLSSLTSVADYRFIESAISNANAKIFWQTGVNSINAFVGKTMHGSTATPTALIDIAAGTTTVPPIRQTSGTLNTTALSGAEEFNGSHYATKGSGLRYAEGGVIFDDYGTSNTGTTETDLFSYTTQANTFVNDKDKIVASYYIETSNAATKTFKVYFGGTVIFDSGAVALTGSQDLKIDVVIYKNGGSSAGCFTTLTANGLSPITKWESVAPTFTVTNILKVTGQAGVGGAGGDIVGRLGTGDFKANANN